MYIKKLDVYLVKQFLTALSGSIIFMIGLFLISIFIDNLKYFAHPDVPLNLILLFTVNIIPEVIIQVLPPAALFATSYTFGNLNTTNEIIAVYNSGTGFTRLISPMVVTGVMLSVFSFLFFEFVSAESSRRAFEIRDHIRIVAGKTPKKMYNRHDFFMMGRDNIIFYIEEFRPKEKLMINPVITRFDSKGNIVSQLYAQFGKYRKGTWTFKHAVVIEFDEEMHISEQREKNYQLDIIETPSSFMKTTRSVIQMRLGEALNFLETKKRMGVDYRKHLVEFQWRFAFPFSIIIVILIGSVAGIYFRKAVIVLSFLLSLIISFGYYGMLAMGLAFGKSGRLNPFIAAWLANMFFLLLAILAIRYKR